MENSLYGKIILVTGATKGIGLVTAREFACLGGQVTLVGRNVAKCSETAERIRMQTGATVGTIVADLSTLEGIRQAAVAFKKSH